MVHDLLNGAILAPVQISIMSINFQCFEFSEESNYTNDRNIIDVLPLPKRVVRLLLEMLDVKLNNRVKIKNNWENNTVSFFKFCYFQNM